MANSYEDYPGTMGAERRVLWEGGRAAGRAETQESTKESDMDEQNLTLEDARQRERVAWDAVKAAKATWDAAWKVTTEIAAREAWIHIEDDDENILKDMLAKAEGG